MKQLIFLFLLTSVAFSTSLAQPITNVVAVQKDTTVEITYTLEGGCPADISVYYCEKNCSEFKGPLKSVSGDAGKAIRPGTKKVIWNVLKDQDILIGNDIIFQVKGERHCTEFTDERDGNIYKTVEIGNQIWMAENLAYKSGKIFYCSYDDEKSNATKYGYLYQWTIALKICPSGWHLPTNNDFSTLIQYIQTFDTIPSLALQLNGRSGFSALLGGWRNENGKYYDLGRKSNFWTSTKNKDGVSWAFTLEQELAIINYYSTHLGFYVRCLKD